MSGYAMGANFTSTYTTTSINQGKAFAVGDATTDASGNEWVFVQASGTVTQYDAVHVDQTFTARSLTPALAVQAGDIAFAHAYGFATTEYGWVMIKGRPTVRLAASCADDVPLYTTDTAGVLDDATVSLSQHQVMGLLANASASAGGITAVATTASWPMIRRPAA